MFEPVFICWLESSRNNSYLQFDLIDQMTPSYLEITIALNYTKETAQGAALYQALVIRLILFYQSVV